MAFVLEEDVEGPKKQKFVLEEEEEKNKSSFGVDWLKGLAEGIQKLGHLMGGASDVEGRTPGQLQKEFTQQLNENLPTEESFLGGAGRKALNVAPTVLATPGQGLVSGLTRSAVGGVSGEAVKQAGGPEWLQNIVEAIPHLAPAFKKEIIPTKNQEEIVDFLRKSGATEEQIAPLLQSEKKEIAGIPLPSKQQLLGKFAAKGKSKQLEKTQELLYGMYDQLRQRPEAKKVLEPSAAAVLMEDLSQKLKNMPVRVRSTIEKDFNELKQSPVDADSLINFYQDIGANYGHRTRQLKALKDPVEKAIHKIDPDVGKDFRMTTDLYAKYKGIRKVLEPSDGFLGKLFDYSRPARILYGLSTGNYLVLTEALGEKAGRVLARKMLTSPRLQNMTKQMANAIKKGGFGVAEIWKNKISDELQKSKVPQARSLKEFKLEEVD